MKRYIVNRLASMVLVLFGVSVLIFVLIRLVPGDVVDVLYGAEAQASPEARRILRENSDFEKGALNPGRLEYRQPDKDW